MSNLSKQPPRSIPPLRAPPLRFGNSPSPDARNTSPFNKPTLPARRQRFVVGLPSKSPVTFQTGTDIHSIEVPTSNSRESMSPGPFRTGSIRLNRLSRENSRVFHSIDLTRPDFSSVKAEPDDAVTFQERLKTPLKDEKIVPEDLSPQSVVGDQAVTNFYSHYKKLSRVQDVNTFMQVRDAVYTSVLGKSESLGLLPSKIGFIKEKGDADVVQLNHFRLGDKYVEVLSEGIKSMKGFGKLELSNNRITPAGADALLSKLNNQTQVLNLAGNNIGKIGAEHLCSVINLKNSKLIEINLDGNKLGDNAVNQLCDAVAYSNSLQRLNLGKNFLSDNAADKLSHMLEYNSSLEELYLSWNQIKSAGGATLVAGLKSASKLRVLDLSWNALGQGGSMFSKNFASYIATNTTLVHLDLSNNYIAKPDATIIAEELKSNHTLYGFHFHGNVGYVDFKGFLVIPEACSHSVAGRVIQPAINGVNFHPESLKHHIGNHGEYHDVCWICEGWRPIEMTWTPGKSGDGGREPIYCHLSFEGHKGIYLPKKAGFTKPRMVPPNQFDYFFTVDDAPVYANNLPYGKPTESQVKAKIGNDERELKVDKMNQCGKTTLFKMFGEEYEPLQIIKSYDIKPRMLDDPYIPPDVLIERPEWKYPVSIFRNFKPDNQAQLDECFRVDFENTRIAKIVKNPDDLQQVRNLLHECYRPLKDCYKHYAAIGAPSDIWSIPSNTFTELCQSCKIIDNKTVKLADFDRIFIATFTRADKDKNPRNPDRALVRYQFLEGLVRLAELKYVQTGTAPTYFDGVKMLLDESLMPYISRFNHQQWRQDRYWNEPVDIVYKSYFPIMRGVYKKYSGAKTLPGQKKFMCLEEFHKLLGDAGLFTDNFGERDATLGFSLAMMTQVDELNSDRIFQMQFVEFLEAFARCADKYSAHPYAYLIYNPQSGLPENEMSYEQRFAQSLEIKLEGLMPFLFAICENNVKELWAMPEASIFGMEEVDPRVRFSTKKKKIMRINPTGMNSIEPYDGFSALQM